MKPLSPLWTAWAAAGAALCGLLLAAAPAVSADWSAGARRTPTPSPTPPAATPSSMPPPLAGPTVTPPAAAGPVRVFDDQAHLVVARYPDGSLAFWRAHPERGDWGFLAWLDERAQCEAGGRPLLRVDNDGWRLYVVVQAAGAPAVPYAAQPALHIQLSDAAGTVVAEGSLGP